MALLYSCKKDKIDIPEESPFFDFLNSTGIKIDTIEKAAVSWEYGFRFSPIKNGQVTKLGIKLPGVGDFKVKLYDLDTQTVLAEQIVSSLVKSEESFLSINNTNLTAGKEYGLSVVADVFFRTTNTNLTAFSFPIKKGSLNILSFNEDNTCGTSGCGKFPVTVNLNRLAPCVNLVFNPDN